LLAFGLGEGALRFACARHRYPEDYVLQA